MTNEGREGELSESDPRERGVGIEKDGARALGASESWGKGSACFVKVAPEASVLATATTSLEVSLRLGVLGAGAGGSAWAVPAMGWAEAEISVPLLTAEVCWALRDLGASNSEEEEDGLGAGALETVL